jgi:hypothetical protein
MSGTGERCDLAVINRTRGVLQRAPAKLAPFRAITEFGDFLLLQNRRRATKTLERSPAPLAKLRFSA